MHDLTVIYLTANVISDHFAMAIQKQIKSVIGDAPIISATKKPTFFGENIVFDTPRSHVNIYKEALEAVKRATTEFIAIAEDDVLYSPEHFGNRPSRGKFAYNYNCWQLFTWHNPPLFSHSGRRNFGQLICERSLFIEAFEERFAKYPDGNGVNNAMWAEPGKYERQLGVTIRETEFFSTNPPNIMFSHPSGLSHLTLGERKRLSTIRAVEIPFWGRAEDVLKKYYE